jgi:hypothetical protein
LAYNYFTFDFQEAAHGRAPAMEIWRVSVWAKSSMPPIEAKSLPQSLLTIRFMV